MNDNDNDKVHHHRYTNGTDVANAVYPFGNHHRHHKDKSDRTGQQTITTVSFQILRCIGCVGDNRVNQSTYCGNIPNGGTKAWDSNQCPNHVASRVTKQHSCHLLHRPGIGLHKRITQQGHGVNGQYSDDDQVNHRHHQSTYLKRGRHGDNSTAQCHGG